MANIVADGVTTVGSFISDVHNLALQPTIARTITLGGSSVNQALTNTCRFVSLICSGGTHCHYQIGTGAQTASATTHYLKTGERITVAVPAGAHIAAIQGTGGSTTLFISELS